MLRVSVIVPARNEADCLGDCLGSLTAQSEPGFALGGEWEILCVNDGSMDATRAIAKSFAGVTVLDAPLLTEGWTGKSAAVWFAAMRSRGAVLLFTDADTVHELGSLRRALHEMEKNNAAMLSYSPKQIVQGFWQRALMPLVFSELQIAFPPKQVSDPASALAAANGQFLMVERAAYFKVGGHKAVAETVLEDVGLARRFKRAGMTIRFRYAADAVSVRMYRSLSAMVEGWTKNLALLFPHALMLAAWRLLDVGLLLLPMLLIPLAYLAMWQKGVILLIWARTVLRYYTRVRRSNFSPLDCASSVFALPLFIGLLVWSWVRHRVLHAVAWKGREYRI
jgi:cellulose synthase/poly-beta-1,6-N-acetylglucosamine synthase-like glycosyltransferase